MVVRRDYGKTENNEDSERLLKSTPTEENHLQYKRKRNDYFRSIKQSKTNMWNTYMEELKGSKVYDGLKQLKPRRTQQTPTIKHEGITASTFAEKADLLRTVMFPALPQFHPQKSGNSNTSLPYAEITENEIREAIFSSSPRKAAGPDGISFLCLREAYNTIPT